jgi:hypothetical protein
MGENDDEILFTASGTYNDIARERVFRRCIPGTTCSTSRNTWMLQDVEAYSSYRGIAVVRDIGRYLVADSKDHVTGRVLSCELESTEVSLERIGPDVDLPSGCEVFYWPGILEPFKPGGVLVDSDRRLVYVRERSGLPPLFPPNPLPQLLFFFLRAQLRG